MAAPYGQFFYYTPYMYQYLNNQPYISPFIPPMNLPPPSPPPHRRVRFEDDPPFSRQRRSWHAGLAPPPNPLPFPSPPILLTPLPPVYPLPAQPAHMPPYSHHRRRSDSCLPPPYWLTVPTIIHPVAYASPSPPTPQIHPLLNGENAAGPKILFDLSLHTFNPQRITSFSQTSGDPLKLDDLLQPATHPPVYHMTITSDRLGDWPIVLEPHTTARDREQEPRSPFLSVPEREAADAPVTVYDVLMAIYRTVQQRISQTDWRRLSTRQTNAVSAAYTRRCRAYPTMEAFDEGQGVRRVDYLLEQYMFRGIMRENAQDGFAKMKLLVGPAR